MRTVKILFELFLKLFFGVYLIIYAFQTKGSPSDFFPKSKDKSWLSLNYRRKFNFLSKMRTNNEGKTCKNGTSKIRTVLKPRFYFDFYVRCVAACRTAKSHRMQIFSSLYSSRMEQAFGSNTYCLV